jgi:lactoylglutathione lyase
MPTKKKTTKKPAAQRKKTPARTSPKRKSAASTKARAPKASDSGLKLRTAAPSLTVNDVERSLTWYTDVLGFGVKERWESDGKLSGVEIAAGGVTFYIGQDDWKKGRDRVKGEGFRMYCRTTQDVDALAERIRTRGGSLLEEPHDEPWGGRALAVVDPDGFKLTITTAD